MFCTNCGSKLPDDALFCPDCGEKVIMDADDPGTRDDQSPVIENEDEDINIPEIEKTVILNGQDDMEKNSTTSEETVNININNHQDDMKKEDTQVVFNDIQESLAHSEIDFENDSTQTDVFQNTDDVNARGSGGDDSFNDSENLPGSSQYSMDADPKDIPETIPNAGPDVGQDPVSGEDYVSRKPKQQNKVALIAAIIACAVVVIAVIIALILMATSSGKKKKNYDDQVDQAQQYMSDSDYDEAIEAFRKAIEIDGDSQDAYLGLADAYIKNQEYRKAAEVLQQGSKATGSKERIEEKKEELYNIAPELKEEFETESPQTQVNSGGTSQTPETVQAPPAVPDTTDSAQTPQTETTAPHTTETETAASQTTETETTPSQTVPPETAGDGENDSKAPETEEPDTTSQEETGEGDQNQDSGNEGSGEVVIVGTMKYQMKKYYHETKLPDGSVGAYTQVVYPYFLDDTKAAETLNAYMSDIIETMGVSEDEVKQYTGEENINFPLYEKASYEVTYGEHGIISMKCVYESTSIPARPMGLIFDGKDGHQLGWADVMYGSEQDLVGLVKKYYDPKANKDMPVEEFLKRVADDWNNCYVNTEGICFIASGDEGAQVIIPLSESQWFRFLSTEDPAVPSDTNAPAQSESTGDSESTQESQNAEKTGFKWVVDPVMEFENIAVIMDDVFGENISNNIPMAVYMKDGKLGFADYDGNILSEPKYNMVYSCSASGESSTLFASVMGSDIWSAKAIDIQTGSELEGTHMGHGGNESVLVYSRSDGKRYYVYYDGFSEMTGTLEGATPVVVVDNIAEADYDSVTADDGVVYGLCNVDGSLIENCLFDHIYMNSGGLMTARLQGKYGVIDESGNVVIPFEYEAASYLDMTAISQHPDQITFCDGSPYPYSEGYIALKKDDLWGYFDGEGNCVTDMVFEEARPLNQGRAFVKKDGFWGIIEIIPQNP